MKIIEIRERKATKVTEMRSILSAAEAANRQLTADESAKFDALKSEVTDLEAQEQRALFLDEQERRSAGRVVEGNRDTFAALEQRASLLDVVRAGIEGRQLTGAAAELHAELEKRHGPAKHGGILVPLSAFEKRENTTTTAAGLVGTDHRADLFIGPLRNSLLVRALGVRTLSGLRGNVTIPKKGTGLSTAWIGEGETIPESTMGAFAGVTLTPRHVGGITEMSRQLIQQSAPAIEDLVRDDLSFAIAEAVDAAIITGPGGDAPVGIIGRAGVQTAAIPATWADVLDVEQRLRGQNVTPSGWYTTTAVQTGLRKILKNASAGSDYLATATTIGDLPSASSNAAPANRAILGDFSQVLVGQWDAVELLTNAYAEGPYRRGGVLVRAMATVDVAIRHEKAFVVCGAGGS